MDGIGGLQMEEKKGFFTKLKEVGPGAIVAAAIVGPGTITAASQAGAGFGMTLIWALVFSVIATMFLQEMSTRLGIITGKDLGTAFREQFSNPVLKFIAVTIVIVASGVGKAAYATRNLLWYGNYKVIEKCFVIMVGIISLSFIITAVVIKPDIGAILSGIFVPKIPEGSIIFVISLIGTTIVPYTFFLQSATVQERWKGKEAVSEGRFDIIFSMIVVAIISVAIVVTAAGAFSL